MNISILPCIFGYVLIAYNNVNILNIEFGQDPDTLYDKFVLDKYPNFKYGSLPLITKIYKTNDNSELVKRVMLVINTGKIDSNIPFALIGTSFRNSVLMVIKNIPMGKTMSYKDIAVAIGNPNAVRAVGTACGSNPIAVIIPCHRVIRSNGQIGEYKWGKEIKKQLLKREVDISLK